MNPFFLYTKTIVKKFYCLGIFDEFPEGNDLVSWNTLMGECVSVSQPCLVFGLFRKMCWVRLEASVATI